MVMKLFAPEFVNRKAQIEVFQNILKGDKKRNVYLIEGEPEIGKSFLLSQLRHLTNSYLPNIDFRDGAKHSYQDIVWRICKALNLSNFSATLEVFHNTGSFTHPNILLKSEEIHETEAVDRTQLRKILQKSFSISELKELCFELNIEPEDLSNQNRSAFVIDLINYCYRRDSLPKLVEEAQKTRPNNNWQNARRDPNQITEYNIENVHVLNRINNKLHSYPIIEGSSIQRELTSVFLTDLAKLATVKPLVLSFDSFELAPPDVQNWLGVHLINELADNKRFSNILVIIAGRQMPANITERHEVQSKVVQAILKGFDFKDATEYWVNRRGLPPEKFSDVYDETQGHPKRIAERASEAGGKRLKHAIMYI